jgi:hypothetical protein
MFEPRFEATISQKPVYVFGNGVVLVALPETIELRDRPGKMLVDG